MRSIALSIAVAFSLSFGTLTDFHVGGHAGIVGARIGFNPLEFLDFVLGFAGLDIAGDDAQVAAKAPTTEP